MRVRPVPSSLPVRNLGFNSRTREGATEVSGFPTDVNSVSIHAPVRVLQKYIIQKIYIICFNSRTRECATILPTYYSEVVHVSIHAPVRVRQNQ